MHVVVFQKAFQEEIEILERKCCGRPMISKGLLDQAAKNAKYNVDLLHEYVEKGYKIVGCESSCIMTLKDEYPDLLNQNEKALKVADNTFMIEEIIAKTHNDGKIGNMNLTSFVLIKVHIINMFIGKLKRKILFLLKTFLKFFLKLDPFNFCNIFKRVIPKKLPHIRGPINLIIVLG